MQASLIFEQTEFPFSFLLAVGVIHTPLKCNLLKPKMNSFCTYTCHCITSSSPANAKLEKQNSDLRQKLRGYHRQYGPNVHVQITLVASCVGSFGHL